MLIARSAVDFLIARNVLGSNFRKTDANSEALAWFGTMMMMLRRMCEPGEKRID